MKYFLIFLSIFTIPNLALSNEFLHVSIDVLNKTDRSILASKTFKWSSDTVVHDSYRSGTCHRALYTETYLSYSLEELKQFHDMPDGSIYPPHRGVAHSVGLVPFITVEIPNVIVTLVRRKFVGFESDSERIKNPPLDEDQILINEVQVERGETKELPVENYIIRIRTFSSAED